MQTEILGRACIVLKGRDVKSFLQSVVTCDVKDLAEDRAIWGVALTPQGKFQYGFIGFEYKGVVYLDCRAKDTVMDFGRYLTKYAVNQDVHFSLENTVRVFANSKSVDERGACYDKKDYISVCDPRCEKMGSRLYTFNNKALPVDCSFEQYERLRIQSAVVDFDRDMVCGKTFPLEAPIDVLHGVSFTKGCYVGQEVTARTFYRGKIKRKFVPLRSKGEGASVGQAILLTTKDGEKQVGIITSCAKDMVMGSLRAQVIHQGATFKTCKGQSLQIQAPDWFFSQIP